MLKVLLICCLVFGLTCYVASMKYHFEDYLWCYVVAAILCLPIMMYVSNFWNHNLSHDPEMWGVFGDFFGGVYNVLISALMLYISYKMSKMKSQSEMNAAIATKLIQQIQKIKKTNYSYKNIEKLMGVLKVEKYKIDPLLYENLIALSDNYIEVKAENANINIELEDAVMRTLHKMSND